MNVYTAFLRGINVSGKNLIKMTELANGFNALGYHEVATYIQSGNVVFSTVTNSPVLLAGQISEMIRERFGYEVTVLIRDAGELAALLANNPFTAVQGYDPAKLYFTLLQNEPDAEYADVIDPGNYLPEEFHLAGKTCYLYAANGAGKSKLSNNFFEVKWKVIATTRNLRTMEKMLSMMREAE
jgi:uncharacterized protein (DUF1697 family)